jgi:signal transduction histidine kinase
MYDPIRKLSRLNQSLLLLMKIENKQFLKTEVIDLRKRVEEKIEQFAELWQNEEIDLSASLEDCQIAANSELIDILLNNLFSNATRHNYHRGLIQVDLTGNILTVRNSGIDHLLDTERVFRRFFKDRPETASNGLGLAIIKEIALANGFHIQYGFEKGLHVFTISFN